MSENFEKVLEDMLGQVPEIGPEQRAHVLAEKKRLEMQLRELIAGFHVTPMVVDGVPLKVARSALNLVALVAVIAETVLERATTTVGDKKVVALDVCNIISSITLRHIESHIIHKLGSMASSGEVMVAVMMAKDDPAKPGDPDAPAPAPTPTPTPEPTPTAATDVEEHGTMVVDVPTTARPVGLEIDLPTPEPAPVVPAIAPSRVLTLDKLLKRGACSDATERFERRHGEQVIVTEDWAEANYSDWDWWWGIDVLLSFDAKHKAHSHVTLERRRLNAEGREYEIILARTFARCYIEDAGNLMEGEKEESGEEETADEEL